MDKMLLVPSGLFPDRLDPSKEKMTQLDHKMKEILERQDIDEYTKATMYTQALQQYLTLKRNVSEPLTIPVVRQQKEISTVETEISPTDPTAKGEVSVDPLSELVQKNIPKKYVQNAKTLLEQVKKSPNVAFNDKGELVIRGRPIRGSHAMDLIDDFVRPPSKGKVAQVEPVGWGEFAKVLKEMNVPRLLIGNMKRWNHMQLHPSNVPMTPPPTQPKQTLSPPTTVMSGTTRPEKPVYKMDVRPRWEPYSK